MQGCNLSKGTCRRIQRVSVGCVVDEVDREILFLDVYSLGDLQS